MMLTNMPRLAVLALAASAALALTGCDGKKQEAAPQQAAAALEKSVGKICAYLTATCGALRFCG